ncbi:NAD-dependent epimerase/dehydratase family protein [Endozoicomonas sp. SCSIO W0465]|uniref:NAD-dependent epimerase/dehydratase family protein n=1 Tax=Endozoicomonas sp. SCSIO W0465 TaxID=2918516 RepID=UPI0020758ACB|nr:NAD-dependent epimerase/dehydratase family protein [Endozoicomonas sp. SCSIO W0465]USE39739.1 NAD-dependent epimerase/dehydratase family protein [Endozoicomonas sp. SCSIO W0465]
MMIKNRKILLTGSNGLVGYNLLNLLSNNGWKNIVPIERSQCDLTKQKETLELFQYHKPEYIFHCAAKVYGIMGNMCNKAQSFYENIMINTNVIQGAHLAGTKKITVMGTGCVYPYPSPSLLLKEDMIFNGRPHESENSYAQAKRAMLAMCEAYQESYDLDWAYVVSCNLFGPNDRFDTEFGHVIPSLIKKFYDAKIQGKCVDVWGDGSAKRDFLYVKDAARATIDIMQNLSGPVNIGSGSVYSIKQIVEYIADIANMKNSYQWDRKKPSGQDYRSYNLSKLDSIGFKPKWSLRKALEETWDWYCENQDLARKNSTLEF